MLKKRNIIIIILILLVLGLTGYIVYDKVLNKEENINNNKNNNSTINITLEFLKYISSKNWEIRNDIYDWGALRDENCTQAIAVDTAGSEFFLELYKYSAEDNAKKQYKSQNEYQLENNSVKKELSSVNNENYDEYEAILIPKFEGALPIDGVEIYLYQLRINNYYINFYESSTNADKTALINIVEELKTALGVK